jgi:cell wall-associated NlpC family hydrolase
MALLTRARGIALAGVTSIAVVMPVAQTAPVAAAPAPQVSATSTAAAHVAAETRRTKSSRSARSVAVRAKVMRTGNSLKGTPYRYGGSTPRGFDCSGYTMYVYRKAGVRLTHSATAQMHKTRRISKRWAKPGDLVFFRSGSRAYHVGIYAGHGKVLHSPRPGKRVRVDKIWTSNVTYGRAV